MDHKGVRVSPGHLSLQARLGLFCTEGTHPAIRRQIVVSVASLQHTARLLKVIHGSREVQGDTRHVTTQSLGR